jgi:teichoic acid transport system permease protein
VFKISVLPIIKIIGALFTHIFFTGVLVLMSLLYGYKPSSLYAPGHILFSFCLFMLVLALSYFNCAVVVFFRDLQQIINIGLQVGMWATPIMWNIEGFGDKYKVIFKLNPLTYIVGGFRSSMCGHEWFWEHFYSTTYFWILTISLFCISGRDGI